MLFADEITNRLGWPPLGEASEVSPQTSIACRKLEQRLSEESPCRVRALPREPKNLATTSKTRSLALVCEFSETPRDETLQKAHELAWNLCEGEQIIFICSDERSIQAWSTLVTAAEWEKAILGEKVFFTTNSKSSENCEQNHLLRSFHWINLVNDSFAQDYPEKFQPENRADRLLVENLKQVRRHLLDWPEAPKFKLSKECCHNLLARLIFIQYLFQRTDSNGRAFLSASVMEKLANDQILSKAYTTLAGILTHKGDTYALFRWLNNRFNGDLFSDNQSGTISKESREVRAEHLRRIAEYLSGEVDLSSGQSLLWKHYSFEVIPINFMSSLYEEFLTEDDVNIDKAHYTPTHLADFILDTALPWNSKDWNIRILDPCCGSGIFIVKAFQRLVHRWKIAHPGKQMPVAVLKKLLKSNIFGVDKNPEAVRVTSFSLCLALADEIDPRQYWKHTVFPALRGISLINDDFFQPSTDNQLNNGQKGQKFDLVIGNPPWGKNSAKQVAKTWANENNWPTSNNDIGPLFLAKGLHLARSGGDAVFIQPSGVLLNQSGPISRFREKIYGEARLVEVNNFSALRFGLFSKAIGPCCVLYVVNEKPEKEDVLTYLCPKQAGNDYVRLEPQDWHEIPRSELEKCPWIWTALMWGEWRSVSLIRKLEKFPTIQSELAENAIRTREGVIRGNRKQTNKALIGRRIIDRNVKLDQLKMDSTLFPINTDAQVDSAASTDFSAFDSPQVIIKQSWTTKKRRFIATKIESSKTGTLCTDSYVSVHSQNKALLERIWLSFNSCVSVWWQLLRSGRLSSHIPQPLEKELRLVPLPRRAKKGISNTSDYQRIDAAAKAAFSLSDGEWAIIQDVFNVVLSDFKDGHKSVGRERTTRDPKTDPLEAYCQWLLKVLEAGLGHQNFSATVYQEKPKNSPLPVRLVGIHLQPRLRLNVTETVQISDIELLELLAKLHQTIFEPQKEPKGVYTERHLRLYDIHNSPHFESPVPTVFIAKPDRQAVWTRTSAMRDADDILNDIIFSNMAEEAAKT